VKNNLASKGKIGRLALILSLLVIALIILIRLRLLQIPLERDEGEYAYAGQLMLQGIPPYTLAYNMKFPGIYVAYAVVMAVFGQTITGIHLGLLLINIATIALIFFLARRLWNEIAGSVAAVSYAVLSVSPSVLGLAAHATHFVMLPVVAGTFLLLGPQSSKRLLASGLLFGVGLLMKQPACFFILYGVSYLLVRDLCTGLGLRQAARRSLLFAIAAILPLAIACLLLFRAGVFNAFWFWTIDYAREYGSLVSIAQARQIFVPNLKTAIGASWPLWVLAAVGLLLWMWNKPPTRHRTLIAGFVACSILALSSGFYFRSHYFVLILPAVSLFVGFAIAGLTSLMPRRIIGLGFTPLLLFAVAAGLFFFAERDVLFRLTPSAVSRQLYWGNPFPESVQIADYLRAHSARSDTIAVLGSEPQIYFYANRHSATGYIYTYGLMEPQKYARQMQEEMIREIERARPKFLISVITRYSWLQRPQSDPLIFTWATEYTAENYSVAGFVNIMPSGQTDYYFTNIPQAVPELGNYILIYERKS
jgi:hypothetical protein